jgi:hypothetical protein
MMLRREELETICATVQLAQYTGLPLHEYVAQELANLPDRISAALSHEVAARRRGKIKVADSCAKQAGRLLAYQARMADMRQRFASWRGPVSSDTAIG